MWEFLQEKNRYDCYAGKIEKETADFKMRRRILQEMCEEWDV